MNAFFQSQFSYCPLIWMFHNRTLQNKINNLQERCLRLVYSDTVSSFEELLIRNNSQTLHQRNLQSLATELYKIKSHLSPNFLENIFTRQNLSINLRNQSDFKSRKIVKPLHGNESLSWLGPKIWNKTPLEIRNLDNLNEFKRQIRKIKFSTCPCRNCRQYLDGVGFIS